MIRFQKYQSKREGVTKDMWYVRAVSDETVDLEGLAKHMSAHNTPYSAGTIHGVLKDMVACVKELVLDGKKIKLADLAIFSAGITSCGVGTAKECGADNIRDIHLCARPTGDLRSRILTAEAKKMQLREYSVTESLYDSGD